MSNLVKKWSNKVGYIIIGVILAIAGTVYAAVSVPNAQQKGDLPSGLTTGNYQLFHPGANGKVLTASSSAPNGLDWTTITGGSGSSTPAGSNTQIQYNNAGAFGADSNFLWSNSSQTLTISNALQLSGSGGILYTDGPLLFTGKSSTTAIELNAIDSAGVVDLDISQSTGNPRFTFPNISGTFCLLTTCTGNSAWTIGNGFIYNATTTDNVGIGTTTPPYRLTVNGITDGTIQDHGGQVYNVKSFGAVGNGSTNDTPSFNRAIAAAHAAGGGDIFLPSGNYKLNSPPTLFNDLTFSGTGSSSLVTLATGAYLSTANLKNINFRYFNIDGSNQVVNPGNGDFGILINNATNVTVDHVNLLNMVCFGIFVNAGGGNTTSDIKITNNIVQGKGNCDVIGGGPNDSTGSVVKDVFVSGNYATQDCTVGTYCNVFDLVAETGFHIIGNTFYGSVQLGSEAFPHTDVDVSNNIIYPAISKPTTVVYVSTNASSTVATNRISITNNTIASGSIESFGVASGTITNLIIANNNITTGALQNGIDIHYAGGGLVSNNIVKGGAAGITFSTSSNFHVAGNYISGTNYGIQQDATSTNITQGINYVTGSVNTNTNGVPGIIINQDDTNTNPVALTVSSNANNDTLRLTNSSGFTRAALAFYDASQVAPAGNYQIQNTGDALTFYRGILGTSAAAKFQINASQVTFSTMGIKNTAGGVFSGPNVYLLSPTATSYINNGFNFGIGSTSPTATLVVQGTSTLPTTDIFSVASSTGSQFLKVAYNGSTTLSTLGSGCVNASSGSLFTAACAVGGGSATTTINGVQGPTFTFSSANPSLTISTSTGNVLFTVPTTTIQGLFSLTTTGTSGASTYNSGTGAFNIPQYQAALTNPDTGTGTNGQVAYFTGATALSSASALLNNGTVIGVNASSSSYSLNVQAGVNTNPFNISSSSGASMLSVMSNGFIEIGTNTPAATLQVSGALSTQGPNTSDVLVLERPFNVGISSGKRASIKIGAGDNVSNSYTRMDFALGNLAFGQNALTLPQVTVMTLQGNNTVGIGSTTPAAVLSVVGTSTIPTFIVASSTNAILLQVASNGSSTFSSLGTGTVCAVSGSLYTGCSPSGVVTSVSGSGSILSSGGTTPTIQLQNLTSNEVLFGQGTNVIATSSNFTFTSASNTLAITGTTTVSNAVLIGTTTLTSPFTAGQTWLAGQGSLNNFLETNLQNTSNGATSSADYVLTANNGTASIYYTDLFQNSSGYIRTSAISGSAGDSGLFNSDASLILGTASTTNTNADLLLVSQGNNIATGTANGFQFSNASTTNLTVATNIYLPGVSNCNSTQFLQITSGIFGCGTPSGGGVATWITGNGLIYNATSTDLVGIGTITPTSTLFLQGKSGTNPFVIASSTGTAMLTVTQAGNLTITGPTIITSGLNISSQTIASIGNNPMVLRGGLTTAIGANITLSANNTQAPTSGTSQQVLISDVGFPGFNPQTGTAVMNTTEIRSTINQGGSSNGITRGLLINPTLTAAYDYRLFETASTTVTIPTSNPVSILYDTLFNPLTYQTTSTTKYTIATSSTVSIKGSPIASTTSLALTNSIGLWIQGNAVTASTTNSYGLYATAPTGATNNYAGVFTGGNVGIGTATPATTLMVQAAPAANPFTIASSSGATYFSIDSNGNVTFGGNLPTVSSGTINTGSTNTRGRVIPAAAATTNTITFSNGGYGTTPYCTMTQETGTGLAFTASATPTTLVMTAVSSFGLDSFSYICFK